MPFTFFNELVYVLCVIKGYLKEKVFCLCSAKPGFFHDENRANIFMVETDSGKLVNTDNGTPLAQVCE